MTMWADFAVAHLLYLAAGQRAETMPIEKPGAWVSRWIGSSH